MDAAAGTTGEALARAQELIMAAQYEPAVEVLREHLAAHPDDAAAWQHLATALTGHGDHTGAVDAASRSIEIDPGSGPAHYSRALAHHLLGRRRESYADAERAVEIAPEEQTALVLLAMNVLLADRDLTRFRELTDRALRVDPDGPAARALLKSYRRIRWLGALAVLYLAAFPAFIVLLFGWFAVDTGSSADSIWMIGPAVIVYALLIVALVVQRLLLRKVSRPRGLVVFGLTRLHVLVAAGSAGVVTAAAAYAATRSGGAAASLGLLSGVLSLLIGLLALRGSRSRTSG